MFIVSICLVLEQCPGQLALLFRSTTFCARTAAADCVCCFACNQSLSNLRLTRKPSCIHNPVIWASVVAGVAPGIGHKWRTSSKYEHVPSFKMLIYDLRLSYLMRIRLPRADCHILSQNDPN
ncbi:hypothetical protein BKA62DRAFT_507051 [Auriculariales sp. MPI-PUGE-AT-0066]|nr:hypothetical protein BKA62DRAFT_507051 [Auriculariales sp. MPI-PUGE-AT-0066]